MGFSLFADVISPYTGIMSKKDILMLELLNSIDLHETYVYE